ncbi:clathrin-coated vesicle protein [Phytophthora cinnamomi]|uniref:clathrin-coated vesicle protein n=1 Tax=Phytophthora cinnamomi TaxID=4785 RepID=UPI003559B5D1|nr:clathrin-coated vesicle protein [Phytophthora cinnamomi]
MTEVVKFATTGIVLLHTTEEARSGVVRSVAMVQQAICSVASSYHSSSVKEAVVTLSRASTESVFALARTLETNSGSCEDVLTRIKSSVRSSFEFLSEWLKVDIHSAPGFSMQIAANFAASFPACLQDDAEYFHADVAETASAVLEIAPGTEDGDAKRQQLAIARADLLRGLYAVVKKLVDMHQSSIANRYLAALGPSLVEIVSSTNYPETAAEFAELDEAEGLLRLLTTQLNDHHGAAFVHMLLPRLAVVLSNPPPTAAENAIPSQVPGILARLLLCFAQTHAAAFKEAVAAMMPTLRGVLETALRLALTGSAPAAGARAPSSFSQGSGPTATKLDLSRYA